MDCEKTGSLIKKLRKEKNLTQAQLSELLGVTNNAVSKWETGHGCPDVSLLAGLSAVFGVNIEDILEGQLNINRPKGGNMKKIKFYFCEQCGNIITAQDEASVSCCGKKLSMLIAEKADESEKLSVEIIDNEYCFSSEHEMTKEHFISFAAFLTADTMIMKKLYPEWGLLFRIPRISHGMLIWYCTQHGLKYQLI